MTGVVSLVRLKQGIYDPLHETRARESLFFPPICGAIAIDSPAARVFGIRSSIPAGGVKNGGFSLH